MEEVKLPEFKNGKKILAGLYAATALTTGGTMSAIKKNADIWFPQSKSKVVQVAKDAVKKAAKDKAKDHIKDTVKKWIIKQS